MIDVREVTLTAFLQVVPGVAEVSIGHAFMADALEAGYAATVRGYLACIAAAGQEPVLSLAPRSFAPSDKL